VSRYFLQLALQNLKRHVWLTALIVLAVSLGIGSSMTVYSVLRAMSSDPIAWKSGRLLTPLIDNFGPQNWRNGRPPVMLSYRDAVALQRDRRGLRQTALFEISVPVTTLDAQAAPVLTYGEAVHADFFTMFDVPFVDGRPWGAADDDARANVVVLRRPLAVQLFPVGGAVGKTLQIEGREYRVVGVIDDWEPSPRFYDVGSNGGDAYGQPTTMFMPFDTAIGANIQANGAVSCLNYNGTDRASFLASECVWVKYWIEVASAADISKIHDYLQAYAAEQKRSGRFTWDAQTPVFTVRQWLDYMKVAPDELRIATLVAVGFLIVCLVNAVALMLARSSRRASEFSLRRALGASRRNLFLQGVWESLLVGVVGAAAGLLWTWAGLAALRNLVPKAIVVTTRVQPAVLVMTVALAVVVTLVAGLYPAWRASRSAATLSLKSL
jgi:putative ABC transport system permease protein